MAHYLTNNEKFHIFSKSPVLSSMAVSQAVNKSGHTVSTNDVWADDVPWFTEVADEAGAITRAADARYNDLILWGSDIYVRKGDKTNGASTGTTFAELWEKHTDLTEARAYALGSVTTQTPTNIVTKTVEIKNASDKVVLKYHVGKQIDLLTTANNANVASTWAARMFIDGKVVDQFVSPTDKVFAGNPSTGYTTLVYTATAAGNKYGFVAEGEAEADFVNNAFAGIVQFNQSRNSGHKFAASVFEYVGDKLDTSISGLRQSIKDISDVTLKGVVASVTADEQTAQKAGITVDNTISTTPVIKLTTGSVATGETKLVTGGAVKTYVDTTALAEGGSITQKIESAINELGDVAVKSDIKISEIKVKSGSTTTTLTPDSNKSVTVEIPEVQAATTSVAGVVTISDNDAIATTDTSEAAATVAAVAATRSAIAGEIGQAIADVKATADSAVQSVTRATGSSTLLTVTDGTDVTISLSTEVATKSDAATAAANAVTTGLATGGNIAQAIATAKSGAEQTAATALSTARGEITTEIGTAVSGLETKLTTGEGSLGKKVEALETATGTTLPAAIEQALTDAKAYSDSLHTTSLDYVVLGDSESLPTASADTLGKIYLVASQNAPTTDGSAISGSYVEYMTRKVSETEYTWEKIGTTAADLSAYAKTADVTTAIATAKSEAIATAKAETTTQVNALAATHAADKAALEASIATKVGEVQWFGENDLLSTKAEVKDGKLVVTEQEVINPNKEIGSALAAWNANVTKVVNNEAFNADGEKIATIETSKIKNGKSMFYQTNLSEYESDLSSLTNGTWMFSTTKIAEFIGDMSSLTTGDDMFAINDELHTFIGDLSSLTYGYCMFNTCKNLTTFISDLSSLTNGYNMFGKTNLSLESIECIADTINEYESLIKITWETLPAEDKRQELVDALSRIVDKGWRLTTNTELTSLFDSEKYTVDSTTVNSKTRDGNSEPETVTISVRSNLDF